MLPLLFAGIGLLLIGLSVPLIRRRVKPNALYGLRVPATFADEWRGGGAGTPALWSGNVF